jgi:DNA-binding transcriptional MerR regulator
MGETSFPFDIPKGALFKAAEVCDLVKVQPYVLRSWETEFPGLGVAKAAGGPRVYRRVDVEQVIRIKHLLLVEGLTLAGARRKLEEEAAPPASLLDSIGPDQRDCLAAIKNGLRSILDLLSGQGVDEGFELKPPVVSDEPRQAPEPAAASSAAASPKAAPRRATARSVRNTSSDRNSARQKRSAT